MKYPRRPEFRGRVLYLPDRNGHCINCGKDLSFDARRSSWCCSQCEKQYYKEVWRKYDYKRILKRDNFTCLKCGRIEQKRQDFRNFKQWTVYLKSMDFHLEVDHIRPIALGGSKYHSSNLWTLCNKCHKIKTKKDIKKITMHKRILREINEYWKIKNQNIKQENYWKTVGIMT